MPPCPPHCAPAAPQQVFIQVVHILYSVQSLQSPEQSQTPWLQQYSPQLHTHSGSRFTAGTALTPFKRLAGLYATVRARCALDCLRRDVSVGRPATAIRKFYETNSYI